MINSQIDRHAENRKALSGLVSPGSAVMICLPMSEERPVAELVEALGARALVLSHELSYAELKSVMDEERPELYVGLPTALLSMLRACGKGSLSRALVVGESCPDTVINEIEEILCTPLRNRLALERDEYSLDESGDIARLDAKLFALGALVDYRISALPGGYKLDGLYNGWIDARQICDVCPEIVAVKLREVSMDDCLMYKEARKIE